MCCYCSISSSEAAAGRVVVAALVIVVIVVVVVETVVSSSRSRRRRSGSGSRVSSSSSSNSSRRRCVPVCIDLLSASWYLGLAAGAAVKNSREFPGVRGTPAGSRGEAAGLVGYMCGETISMSNVSLFFIPP